MKFSKKNTKICIIGLGYVGLPLAFEFSKKIKVLGFDNNISRIMELKNFNDSTKEVSKEMLMKRKNLSYSNSNNDLLNCNVFIVTVPTPVDINLIPDLNFLINATEIISKNLKKNDVVIYESTVYPGTTEEICIPILEKKSKLKLNKDFYVGYSPERINPGDKSRKLININKVISGSNEETLNFVYDLYRLILKKEIFKAESIKVAEASKIIENTQRDLNIALINEFSQLFSIMNIDTKSVLEAASTKWNFLKYSPGLVGGHCIGVDPYYLTHKAKQVGFYPQIILAGRRVNESMAEHFATRILKKTIDKNIDPRNAKVLILGITFKENCADIRNSKVYTLIKHLELFGMKIDIFDPVAHIPISHRSYKYIFSPKKNSYDIIVLSVPHKKIIDLGYKKIISWARKLNLFVDLKSSFPNDRSDLRL